jgi:hypothetical protein
MNRHVALTKPPLAPGAFSCLHRHDLGTLLLAARAAMAGDLARRGQRLDIAPQGGPQTVTGPTRALATLVMDAIRLVTQASRHGARLTADIIDDAGDLVLIVAGERRLADGAGIHAAFGGMTADLLPMPLPGCEAELIEDDAGPLAIVRFCPMPWPQAPHLG